MRILIRTSRWAIWSRRVGSFALPVTIVPVLLHRAALIDSQTFEAIEFAAIGFSILAVLLALGAFVSLWISGDRGWGRATAGGLLGLLCLLPAAYLLFLALRYPMLGDVSTDVADPLPLVFAVASPTAGADVQEMRAAYPNVQTRIYALDPMQVFQLVEGLSAAREWTVELRRVPQALSDAGQLNAVATSLFGWRDEVSIRVRGAGNGSRVDMRSVSRSAIHEPGANGHRIESFLLDLDNAVTVTMRDSSAAAPAASEEPKPDDAQVE